MPKRISCHLLGSLLLAGLTSISHASEQPTLQERMTQDEFRAAELDKLSPEALRRLDEWLAAHPTTVTKLVTASNKPVFYPDDAARERIESRIEGLFTGWTGKTVFKLQNGQEWTQVESGRFDGGKLHNPKVKLEPTMSGGWLMFVSGCDCNLHVDRTK